MTIRSPIAILDLDDTISDLRQNLMETVAVLKGKNVHWKDWDILSMEHIYGITNDEFLEIALHTNMLERSLPHLWAARFTEELVARGYEIHILTARSWHPRGTEITRHWLGLWGIQYHKLTLCGLEYDKANYIRDMDNVAFTLDDSLRHCNSYARMQENRPEQVFVYDMPWNTTADPSAIRVKDYWEVLQHITKD